MLRQQCATITIATPGPGLTDITNDVEKFLSAAKIDEGLLTAFLRERQRS